MRKTNSQLVFALTAGVNIGFCAGMACAHDPAKDAFARDLANCARTAPTVEESGRCRAEVEKRYAPLWKDGGK